MTEPGQNADYACPEGWEHVGWIDEYGQLWARLLRNGAVPTDRKVYAPPAHIDGSGAREVEG